MFPLPKPAHKKFYFRQHYPNVFDDRNKAYAIPAGVEYKLLRQETGENCYILTEYPLDRSQLDWTTFGEP